ncbi:MAG: hypothetical protein WBD31_09860, partial [Rubripirellula sp.]
LQSDPRWPARYVVQGPLALAHHYAGDREQAEHALDLSREWIGDVLDEILESPQQPVAMPWFDLVEALQIHDEASRAISGAASSLGPQVDRIREVSLGLIAGPSDRRPN